MIEFNKLARIFLIALVAVSFTAVTEAQTIFTNQADITLEPNAEIFVEGDFVNQEGGQLDNNGNIYVSGDWSNNSSSDLFSDNRGTVILNGSDQIIFGETTKFGVLDLSRGEGSVALFTDLLISSDGALAINDRLLSLNANKLEVNNPSSDAITYQAGGIISENESSIVKWYLGLNTGEYIIPFINMTGKAIPVSVNALSEDNGTLKVSTYSTDNYNYPRPFGVTNMSVDGLNKPLTSIDRFWSVDLGEKKADASFAYVSEDLEGNDINASEIKAIKWSVDSWEEQEGLNNVGDQVYVVENIESGKWSLNSNPMDLSLNVYPVPAIHDLNVEVYMGDQKTGKASVEIIDGFGRALQNQDVQVTSDGSKFQMDVSQLPLGYYMIKVEVDGKMVAKKFYKEDKQ